MKGMETLSRESAVSQLAFGAGTYRTRVEDVNIRDMLLGQTHRWRALVSFIKDT